MLAPRRHPRVLSLLSSALVLAAVAACSGAPSPATSGPGAATAADVANPTAAGWSEASHGKGADPAVGTVFPDDKVQSLTLTIAPADWQAMLDDMTRLYGDRGPSGGPRSGSSPLRPSGPGIAPVGKAGVAENPIWVKATVSYGDRTWTDVGLRFKGNSSLRSAWQSGSDVLPIKLEFDHWEDDVPAVKDQRFFGFQTVSLSTNWVDATAMRDTLINEVLASAGLVAPHTGFYQVSLDRGEGPKPLGIYTMIEEIDDTVVPRAFEQKGGNIYKPDGNAASFQAGTQALIPTAFQKENNKASDWSDVLALYTVLHDERRTTDAAAWRRDLEKIFDVDTFLHVLAVLAVAQDWDSYGGMAHNYYLYHDPSTDRLTWIAWDHNLALGAQGGGAPVGTGRGTALDKADVSDRWPLIRYLLDQPAYMATYRRHLKSTVDGPFADAAIQARVSRYAGLLAPYKTDAGFQAAVQTLIQAAQTRVEAVDTFLATP